MKYARKSIAPNTMKCKWENCSMDNTVNSKYCHIHKAEARQRWNEVVSAQTEERQKRYKVYETAFKKAFQEASNTGENHVPTPMVVTERINPLDNESPLKNVYEPISDGVCGFAWIVIYPGTSSLAKYAKKYQGFAPHYYGGVALNVRKYGQSYERKTMFAHTFVETLTKELGEYAKGVRIGTGGRLD